MATRFLWVSMTPLASPVVPEEYGRAHHVIGSDRDLRGQRRPGQRAQRPDRQGPVSAARPVGLAEQVDPGDPVPLQARVAVSASGAVVTRIRAPESAS